MKDFAKVFSAILMLLFHSKETEEAVSPNIIFILADDYGWNDVSFHGSDQIPTPNIDALAYHGVILNSHYTLPLCTPSRAALMTGLYPIHNGMQSGAIKPTQKKALPEGKILPQYLKDLNYKTVAVGKWHLGHYRPDFLPIKRGFDSFLGYYNGFNSYYDFVPEWPRPGGGYVYGFDMRRNETPAYDLVGQYATDLFTDEAVRTIKTHDKKKPLFLYMSHLAVHAGNDGKLLEAPQETVNKFKYIGEANRRTYAAIVAKLDESVGKIVTALEEKDMLKNSIIVFLADNGAPTIGTFQNWGSNYPLRGIKETLWEGAMRGVGCIWSPLIKGTPRVSNELFHMSDWLPTLYTAAGGNPSRLPIMDGVDQWESITKNVPSRRKEVLLNIEDQAKAGALRINTPEHHWKIVVGTLQKGKYDGYYGQGNYLDAKDNPPYKLEAITTSDTYRAFEKLYKTYSSPPVTPRIMIPFLRDQATVKCNNPVFNRKGCNPAENSNNVCLYDLKTDPCELNDLSSQNPYIVYKLLNKLNEYNQTVIPTEFCPLEDNIADPVFFNGTWSPWYNSNNVPIVLIREREMDIL